MQIIRPQALRILRTCLGWCGREDEDLMSHLLPLSPPLPRLSGQARVGATLLLPLPPVLLPGASAVEQGWGWKGIFSIFMEELDDPNPPGYESRKPSLSINCFLICGHAADTHENHICHSELRIFFVVWWIRGLSLKY